MGRGIKPIVLGLTLWLRWGRQNHILELRHLSGKLEGSYMEWMIRRKIWIRLWRKMILSLMKGLENYRRISLLMKLRRLEKRKRKGPKCIRKCRI